MTITEKMYAVMSAETAITDLVPATRILTPGPWQNIARPYIIHFPVALQPTIVHGSHAALKMWDFYQVSVFADSYPQGDAVAAALVATLPGNYDGVEVMLSAGTTYYEGQRPLDERATTQSFHFVVEFRIAEAL